MRSIPGHWLAVYLFALILISGIWIGSPRLPFLWIATVALSALVVLREIPLELPARDSVRLTMRDAALAAIVSGPVFVYLAMTWAQEFPYGGDQTLHNGAGLEAFAFWWWLPWICAIAALVIVIRWPRSSLPALILLGLIGIATAQVRTFVGWYPATLHFLTVPLHALPFNSSLNPERLLNALSIPAWLLILRPKIVGRTADWMSVAVGVFLFWQKDVVYYFTSGYLEPWAIVLLLTAAEHLVRFESQMIWRPLLLVGAAAMFKEHVIISLPVVATIYFPFRASWRQRLDYVVIVTVAIFPFLLFFFLRRAFRPVETMMPVARAFSGAHMGAFVDRVHLQFGTALPLVIVAMLALIVLAFRHRAFAALLAAAIIDWAFFFSAGMQQHWAGYPRINLVPLAYAAIAVGFLLERRSRAAAIAVIAALNAIVLLPFFAAATRSDTSRNFIEHVEVPIFFPIRESIERAERAGFIAPRDAINLLNNGKNFSNDFYPGPMQDLYPDLAARHPTRIQSFAHDPERCRCSAAGANIAIFIRFENLGASHPKRRVIESEAEQCRQEMRATCKRTMPIENEGVIVSMIGSL
jgi:hypothetical protein